MPEDGATYVDNAVKKAAAIAEAGGLVALADDTGLEVEALNGAPGLHSKRYLPQTKAPPMPTGARTCCRI